MNLKFLKRKGPSNPNIYKSYIPIVWCAAGFDLIAPLFNFLGEISLVGAGSFVGDC